jgi:beta-carotene 15,15'-dioxygenase
MFRMAGSTPPNFFTATRCLVLLLGAILAIAHLSAIVSPWIDITFFIVFVLAVGIPHGAVDHLIEERSAAKRGLPFSMLRFLLVYLLQMLGYATLWYFFPALSFGIFLLLSAWHFGESDLQPAPRHFLWKLSQLFLGSLILFFILMRQSSLTAEVIGGITLQHQAVLDVWQLLADNAPLTYSILVLAFIASAAAAQNAAPISFRAEKWIYLMLLLLVMYFLPVLPAFALYFGGWHALNTFGQMADFLGEDKNVWALWKAALPFTLVAAVSLVIFAVFSLLSFPQIDPIPVLFIFIAVITLPHLLVMNRMFALR